MKEPDWSGVVAGEEDREGRCTLTILVNNVPEIKSWIKTWGPECEVIAPGALRREVAEEIKAASAIYE